MDSIGGYLNRTKVLDFPDPFISFSNRVYPNTVKEVFDWAEYLWNRHGIYSQSIRRCVRYFLCGFDLTGDGVSREVRAKYSTYLIDQLNLLDVMGQVGDEIIGFGNCFTSVNVPLHRNLVCPKCNLSRPIESMKLNKDYKFADYKFTGDCPACKAKTVVFKRVDVTRATDEDPLRVVFWAPQHIRIEHCELTGDSRYYYCIPVEERTRISLGEEIYLHSVPWEFVMCVKDNTDFELNPDTFKHCKLMPNATLRPKMRGWGLPLFMSNFGQVVHLQILERYNEALAMDWLIPFRVISPPAQGPGGEDPMVQMSMSNFMGSVRRMLEEHRLDPTTWHTLPMPVQYQTLGGEAKALAPVELIERATDILLSSMGIPQDFYRPTLSMGGGPPISLRMFERTWMHYITNIEDWMNWFLAQCAKIMNWETVHATLMKTSVIEDETNKQIRLNLASSGVISKQTALLPLNIDPDIELQRISDERKREAEQAREEQRAMAKSDMLDQAMPPVPPIPPNASQPMNGMPLPPPGAEGAPPGMPPGMPGGAPGMGSAVNNGMPPTLEQMTADAQSMAQQLMVMDPTSRRRELVNLKSQNPSVHALVKQMLTDMEQQAGQAGVQAARSGQMG